MADPDGELTLDDVLGGLGGGSGTSNLSQLVGGEFYEPRYGTIGRLQVQTVGGTRQYRLILPNGKKLVIASGRTLVDPNTRQSYTIGGIKGDKASRDFEILSEGKVTEGDLKRFAAAGGTVGTGLGDSAAVAHDYAADAFTAAENEKERAFRAEQDRLQREESRRQQLLATARDMLSERMGDRRAARTQGVELAGNDPFRLLGQIHQTATGSAPTPYDIFKTGVGQQATQEVPNITGNESIQDLESAIQKLQGMGGQTPNALGFAGGGTTSLPGPLEARLIGEQGSYIAPGTEVLLTGGGQATVIPLGPGMQTGGTTSTGGSNSLVNTSLGTVNLSVVPQLFDRLRRDVSGGRPESFSQLGYLEPGQTGRSPQLGQGFGAMAEPLTLRQGYGDLVKSGVISQQDADVITNAIGILPNPRNAANWLRTLTPVEKMAVLDLYKLAGVTEDNFKALTQSALLTGPQRQAVNVAA